jgi:hypothetical protein
MIDPENEPELEGESLLSSEFAAIGIDTVGTYPPTVKAARKLDDWPAWDISIKKELALHKQMHTWELVEPPPEPSIIGSCIVLCYKHSATGDITSRKA